MATTALQPVNTPARPKNIEVFWVSLLCLVLTTGCAIYFAPQWAWLVIAASMTVYLLFLGRWICGRPLGILVNERNLMSLSRFQMAAWTVLLLSSFFAIALKRLHVLASNPVAQPLNISMNWRLWALMGISATSLVGTPLLLSSKSEQPADPKVVDKAAADLNEPAEEIQANSQGKLYSNANIRDASLSDMFQGDEVGDAAYVDLSKIQMFYFTVIGIVAYACAVYLAMTNIYTQERFSLPAPPEALVALLGISHAAYLTSITTQHS